MTERLGSVMMDWQLSSYFGWGVYGVNLLLNWPRGRNDYLLTKLPVDRTFIDLNPVEWALIRPALERSTELQTQLEPFAGGHVAINMPALHALGNDFMGAASGVTVTGAPSIGVTFFETTTFSAAGQERAKAFPVTVAGSSWNRAVLEHAGIGPTALALQGVDPTLFHTGPKAGWFAGRFTIFSGGKLEYRKGQDLVLRAFRAFAARHPEALLVTAWASPWPGVARSIDADSRLTPVAFRPDGTLDAAAWAAANGIPPEQFIDLGALPNSALPRLYREMDVGLFPNRCEGGTNLVAMECMACGVPVILSGNTGHLDLIAADRTFALAEQAPIPGDDHLGWGESDVAEIVETLESVHADPAAAWARAHRAAAFMASMTWADTVRALRQIVGSYL